MINFVLRKTNNGPGRKPEGGKTAPSSKAKRRFEKRYLVLIVAAALAVVSVRTQCACDVFDAISAFCSDSSLTSIPECVPNNIITLNIRTLSIPLVKETISRFKDLKVLYIEFFEDPQISKSFLQGHPYLDMFAIYQTSSSYVDNEWFMYSPRIRYLDFRGNKITSLAADTFSYLPILNRVSLADNQLSILPPTLFVGTAVTQVDLGGNPWSCDCEIFNLVQWSKDNGVTISEDAVCANPPELAGLRLVQLTPDLGCKK